MTVHFIRSNADVEHCRAQLWIHAIKMSNSPNARPEDRQKATALMRIVQDMCDSDQAIAAMDGTTCMGLMLIDQKTTSTEIEQWVTRAGTRGVGKAMLNFVKKIPGCKTIKLFPTLLSRDVYLGHMGFGESSGGYLQMRLTGGGWQPESVAVSSAAAVAPALPLPPPPPDSPPPSPPPLFLAAELIPPAPLFRSRSASAPPTSDNRALLPRMSRPGAPAALIPPYACLPHTPPPPPPPPDETS